MKRKPAARPRAPRRRRGELRVAALLEAAAAVFTERGFQAATMTEIAARAGAAIGSLYQFFPSKEALAGALLQRYAEAMALGLGEVDRQARALSPQVFAGWLVDRRLRRRLERDAVLALVDAPGAAEERARFAGEIERRLAVALRATRPSLTARRSRAMAAVVLQVLRGLPALAEADRRQPLGRVGEVKALLAGYLASGR